MASATLAGHRVTKGKLQIPKWGCAYAVVDLDGEHTLTGLQSLVISDLTQKCTVLSGGPLKGRSQYRLVAGYAGWGKTLKRKSYTNDAGVRARTVLEDAARECGETLDTSTISSDLRLGPAFVRPEGPAVSVLELVAARAWYVGEDGVTRLGARTGGTVPVGAARTQGPDQARQTVTLASEKIASILPGLVVDGITAVDVHHEVSAEGGIRSMIWGDRGSSASRGLDAAEELMDALDRDRKFRGFTEYRVVTRDGKRLNLQAVRASSGMPDLPRVIIRPGVAGAETDVALGSRVLVSFIEGDPSMPFVSHFEDPEGPGFVPDVIKLGGGANFVALANLVASELSSIASALATHTHAGVTAGAGVTGTPAAPPYTAGSVAATKVKAT